MTNREKLAQMSNEELAKRILAKSLSNTSCLWCINRTKVCDNWSVEVCKKNIEKWLDSEVEE